MRSRIFLLFIALINYASLGNTSPIMAIVNNEIITKSDFEERKKLIAITQPNQTIKPAELKKNILDSLINDLILSQQAKKFGISIPEQEVQLTMKRIEELNNMPIGYLNSFFKEQHILTTYQNRLKSDLIKNRLISELRHSVQVSKSEVDKELLAQHSSQLKVSLKIITSNDTSQNTYQKMSKLHKSLSNANVLPKDYEIFARVERMHAAYNQLPSDLASLINKLIHENKTDILNRNGRYQIVILEDLEADKSLREQIENGLLHQKLMIEAQKFLNRIKQHAYIKILN